LECLSHGASGCSLDMDIVLLESPLMFQKPLFSFLATVRFAVYHTIPCHPLIQSTGTFKSSEAAKEKIRQLRLDDIDFSYDERRWHLPLELKLTGDGIFLSLLNVPSRRCQCLLSPPAGVV
jgi:hypothetical protein